MLWEPRGRVGQKCGMLHWLDFLSILESMAPSFEAINVEMFSRDCEDFRVILPGDWGWL